MEYSDNNQASHKNSSQRHISVKFIVISLIAVFIFAISSFWLITRFGPKYIPVENLQINGEIIKKNEAVVKLTAQVIKKHMDSLLVLGSSYSVNKEVVRNIQQEKWENAVNIMADAFKEDTLGGIDRIALFDIMGTVKGNIPPGQSQLIGQNFVSREWYSAVMIDLKPYVTDVHIRPTLPPANIVSMAFPIKNNNDTLIAVMLFTIKTESFLKWLNEIKVGKSGLTFIVDQHAQVVAHPEIPPQGEIVSYSTRTDVQKAISGQSGTEITINEKNDRIITSFEPIPEFNWGVISRITIDELEDSGLIKKNPGRSGGDSGGGALLKP